MFLLPWLSPDTLSWFKRNSGGVGQRWRSGGLLVVLLLLVTPGVHAAGVTTVPDALMSRADAAGVRTGTPAASGVHTGTFTQVSAGSKHTCDLKTDGKIICWGSGEGR